MQRRHFMKLTGMLATLPAIKGIAAVSYTHLTLPTKLEV